MARDVMTHGDLLPTNVLVDDGRLAGVLDTGGFAPADPALDAAAACHFLGDGARARSTLDSTLWYDVDTIPAMLRMSSVALQRVMADSA